MNPDDKAEVALNKAELALQMARWANMLSGYGIEMATLPKNEAVLMQDYTELSQMAVISCREALAELMEIQKSGASNETV